VKVLPTPSALSTSIAPPPARSRFQCRIGGYAVLIGRETAFFNTLRRL